MAVQHSSNLEFKTEKLGHLAYDFFPAESKDLWLFLPGFPGPAAPQSPADKRVSTIDTFAMLAKKHNKNVAYLYYSGLVASDGSFSFLKSTDDGVILYKHLRQKDFHVSLIGHSWGAVVAAKIINSCEFNKKLLLITPFLFLPDSDTAKIFFSELLDSYPDVFGNSSVNRLVDEFEQIKSRLNIESALKSINRANISAIVASDDEVVPKPLLQRFLDKLNIKYSIIKDGHSFETNKDFTESVENLAFY